MRIEILDRDNYTCQYCGRSAPEVKLEIDHKTPWSKGGKTTKDNLVTACFDCNRGKSDKILRNFRNNNEEIAKKHKEELKAITREYEKKLKVKQEKIEFKEIEIKSNKEEINKLEYKIHYLENQVKLEKSLAKFYENLSDYNNTTAQNSLEICHRWENKYAELNMIKFSEKECRKSAIHSFCVGLIFGIVFMLIVNFASGKI